MNKLCRCGRVIDGKPCLCGATPKVVQASPGGHVVRYSGGPPKPKFVFANGELRRAKC